MSHLPILLLLISSALCAEPLKPFIPAEPALPAFWWPLHIDANSALQESVYGLAPGDPASAATDALHSSTESVIYARALYKPRVAKLSSLAALIEADQKQFRSRNPEVEISAADPVRMGDGEILASYTYFPKERGVWERVTYSEAGDYYLLFTLRAQSQQHYQQDLERYLSYIRKYRRALITSVRAASDRRELLKKRGEERRSGRQATPATELDDLRLN